MANEFSLVSALVGMIVGALSTFASGYLLFQTKQGCREVRAECAKLGHAHGEITDQAISILRQEMRELKDAMACQKRMLMALILYSDIPEDKRAEILRS
jgi:hypothetical protein